MNPNDVEVVQRGGEPGLPLEGFKVLRVVGDGLIDEFDGDDTVQHGVLGAVDRTLAANGYLL